MVFSRIYFTPNHIELIIIIIILYRKLEQHLIGVADRRKTDFGVPAPGSSKSSSLNPHGALISMVVLPVPILYENVSYRLANKLYFTLTTPRTAQEIVLVLDEKDQSSERGAYVCKQGTVPTRGGTPCLHDSAASPDVLLCRRRPEQCCCLGCVSSRCVTTKDEGRIIIIISVLYNNTRVVLVVITVRHYI